MNEFKPTKSRYIKGYEYDAEALTLTVIFSNGVERVYKEVEPPMMSQVFDTPGSIGKKFNKIIASRYKGSEA